MDKPIGDDHFAIDVSENLADNQAILTVDGKQFIIQFGELADLAAVIEKLTPSDVLMSRPTHDKFVAKMAAHGVKPSPIN